MCKPKYKYRLINELHAMNVIDYETAMIWIPEFLLKISKRSWKRWIYTLEKDSFSIPAESMLLLANFFDCPVEQLFNTPGRNKTEILQSFEVARKAFQLTLELD